MRAVTLSLLLLLSATVSASDGIVPSFVSEDLSVSITHDESSRTIIVSTGQSTFQLAYGSATDSESLTMTSVVPVVRGHVLHVDIQDHLTGHDHVVDKHTVIHRIDGGIEYLDEDGDGMLGVNSSQTDWSQFETNTFTEKIVASVDFSVLDWTAEIHSDELTGDMSKTTIRLTSANAPLIGDDGALIRLLPLIQYQFVWTTAISMDEEVLIPVFELEVNDGLQVTDARQNPPVKTPVHKTTSQWKYEQIIEGWGSTTSDNNTRLHISSQIIQAIELDKASELWMDYHRVTSPTPLQPVAYVLHDDISESVRIPQITSMKLQGTHVRFYADLSEMSVFSEIKWAANVTVDGAEHDVFSQVDGGGMVNTSEVDSPILNSANGWIIRTGLNYPLGQYSFHDQSMLTEGAQYDAYFVEEANKNAAESVINTVIGPLMGVVFLAFLLLAASVARNPAILQSGTPMSLETVTSSRRTSIVTPGFESEE